MVKSHLFCAYLRYVWRVGYIWSRCAIADFLILNESSSNGHSKKSKLVIFGWILIKNEQKQKKLLKGGLCKKRGKWSTSFKTFFYLYFEMMDHSDDSDNEVNLHRCFRKPTPQIRPAFNAYERTMAMLNESRVSCSSYLTNILLLSFSATHKKTR